MMIGLKVLERLRPTLRRARQEQKARLALNNPDEDQPVDRDDPSFGQIPLLPNEDETDEADEVEAGVQEIRLQDVIHDPKRWEPGSVVIGACEDGLPFVLDLNNPAPGSLLVAGDAGSGKTRLLQSILTSTVLLNPPSQVSFTILGNFPEEYTGLGEAANCQNLIATEDEGASDAVMAFAAAVEQRRRSTPRGPAMILVIDNLASLAQSINSHALEQLYGLVRHGPRARIWVIAALPTEQLDWVDDRLLAAFRTHLLGSIVSPWQAERLGADEQAAVENLQPGTQFCAPFADNWMRFWICSPD
jgi:hypothetical protein